MARPKKEEKLKHKPIHRGCRYQEPRHRIHLAHSLRSVDAHRQPNCDRLRPPMVPAPHLHADQYLITFAMLTFVVFSVVDRKSVV